MMEVTMGIIGKSMLSRDILADHPDLYTAFLVASEHIINRATTLSGRITPLFLPTTRNRAFKESLATIHGLLEEAVRERQAIPPHERPADLLTMLIAGRDEESGFTLTTGQLMDELYGIVTAGHETTSLALAALFYELARDDRATEKVLAELDTLLEGRLPTSDDLPALPYLQATIDEALRRYPSAYITTRQAIEADELLGYPIPAGATIIINIYGLHHHNDYWHEPFSFDPARWGRDTINRDAFLPFGAGPRKCIGEPLARLEMALIAATILQRYRFQGTRPVTLRARFTLRAEDGIWLTPVER
jgi:cytochrome P450